MNPSFMRKFIFIFLTLSLIAFWQISCQQSDDQDNTITIKAADTTQNNIALVTSTDTDGKKMTMLFDNDKDIVTVLFNGDSIFLKRQASASGIWYTNNHYELNGKGNDYHLIKDGKMIFSHEDEIVRSTATNTDGDTLRMIFNNTSNTAKLYLNDDPEINLTIQRSGSGIRYTNSEYELRGKGEHVELKKKGKLIFSNIDSSINN